MNVPVQICKSVLQFALWIIKYIFYLSMTKFSLIQASSFQMIMNEQLQHDYFLLLMIVFWLFTICICGFNNE